jgi:pectinesterase inhibitor-like protein
MEDYGFCNRVFHENMKSPSIDYVGLTAIAMDQTITNATNTYEYILGLLKNTTDQPLRNVLVACENAFGIVKSSFGAALQSFNRKDYDDMFKLERVAPRAQASCETSVTAPPSPPNPLAERNREMRILITMAIASGKEILKRLCFLLGLLICKQPFSSFKAYSFIYIGGFILQGIKFEPFVYFDSFSSQFFSLYIYILFRT